MCTLDAKSVIIAPFRPWLSWIERRPPEAEVRGSNPLGRATFTKHSALKKRLYRLLIRQEQGPLT